MTQVYFHDASVIPEVMTQVSFQRPLRISSHYHKLRRPIFLLWRILTIFHPLPKPDLKHFIEISRRRIRVKLCLRVQWKYRKTNNPNIIYHHIWWHTSIYHHIWLHTRQQWCTVFYIWWHTRQQWCTVSYIWWHTSIYHHIWWHTRQQWCTVSYIDWPYDPILHISTLQGSLFFLFQILLLTLCALFAVSLGEGEFTL